jgi:hypothetical protein
MRYTNLGLMRLFVMVVIASDASISTAMKRVTAADAWTGESNWRQVSLRFLALRRRLIPIQLLLLTADLAATSSSRLGGTASRRTRGGRLRFLRRTGRSGLPVHD